MSDQKENQTTNETKKEQIEMNESVELVSMPWRSRARMLRKDFEKVDPSIVIREIYQNACESGASQFVIDVVTSPYDVETIQMHDDGPGVDESVMRGLMAALGESGHDGSDNMGIGARVATTFFHRTATFVSRVEGGSPIAIDYVWDDMQGPMVVAQGSDLLREAESWEWPLRKMHGSCWLFPKPEDVPVSSMARFLANRYRNFPSAVHARLPHAGAKSDSALRRIPSFEEAMDHFSDASGEVTDRSSGWSVNWWVLPSTGTGYGGASRKKRTTGFMAAQVQGELLHRHPNYGFKSGGNRSSYQMFGISKNSTRSRLVLIVTPPEGLYTMDAARGRLATRDGEQFDYREIGYFFAKNMPQEIRDLEWTDLVTGDDSDKIKARTKRFLDQFPKVDSVNLQKVGETPGVDEGTSAGSTEGDAGSGDGAGSDGGDGSSSSDAASSTPSDDARRRKGLNEKTRRVPSYTVVSQSDFDEEAAALGVPLYVNPSTAQCVVNGEHAIWDSITHQVIHKLGEVVFEGERYQSVKAVTISEAGVAGAVHIGLVGHASNSCGLKRKVETKRHLMSKEAAWYPIVFGSYPLVDGVVKEIKGG